MVFVPLKLIEMKLVSLVSSLILVEGWSIKSFLSHEILIRGKCIAYLQLILIPCSNNIKRVQEEVIEEFRSYSFLKNILLMSAFQLALIQD